jgi:hypothetical protein
MIALVLRCPRDEPPAAVSTSEAERVADDDCLGLAKETEAYHRARRRQLRRPSGLGTVPRLDQRKHVHDSALERKDPHSGPQLVMENSGRYPGLT